MSNNFSVPASSSSPSSSPGSLPPPPPPSSADTRLNVTVASFRTATKKHEEEVQKQLEHSAESQRVAASLKAENEDFRARIVSLERKLELDRERCVQFELLYMYTSFVHTVFLIFCI